MNVVRFGGVSNSTYVNHTRPSCHPSQTTEAIVLFTFSGLGMFANGVLMLLIILKRPLRRWSQGLLFHQGFVDCIRAGLLVPLAYDVFYCQKLPKCSYVETAFLLMVTVSTVNMLTSVINDAPLIPEGVLDDSSQHAVILDSRQCVFFGLFIIWFSSMTINLGPTFLSGTLWSVRDHDACPMVHGSVRHYVLNVLWVLVNVLCVLLTGVHLRRLYRDLTKSNLEALRIAGLVTTMLTVREATSSAGSSGPTEPPPVQSYIQRLEQEGVRRVKMFVVILGAYLVFWGPLFGTMMVFPSQEDKTPSITYEVTLHVAFIHAFVNPTLLLVLHKDLRGAAKDMSCFRCGTASKAEFDVPEIPCRPYMETTL